MSHAAGMIRQIVYGLVALLFAWLAIVMLGPVIAALLQRQMPTGDPGLGIATVALGLACVGASAWCLRHSAMPGRQGR